MKRTFFGLARLAVEEQSRSLQDVRRQEESALAAQRLDIGEEQENEVVEHTI